MNILFLLLKNNFIWRFNLNYIHSADKKKRRKSIINLITNIFMICFLVAFMLGISYIICEFGFQDMLPGIAIVFSGIFGLITSTIRALGTLFDTTEYDRLNSLPIPKNILILYKYMTIYLPCLVMSGGVSIPTLIMFCIYAKASALIWVLSLLVVFLIPFIPVAIGSLIAFVINYFGTLFKGSQLISGIITILFITMGLVVYYAFIFGNVKNGMYNGEMSGFIKFMMPLQLASAGLVTGNLFDFSSFFIICLFFFILLYVILFKNLGSISFKLRQSSSSSTYNFDVNAPKMKTNGVSLAIAKKEIRQLFNNSTLIGNSFFGIAFVFLLSLLLVFARLSGNDPLYFIDQYFGENGFIYMQSIPCIILQGNSWSPIIIVAWVCGFFMLCPMGASSFSLEGKSKWILPSLPISNFEIVIGKFLPFVIICLPLIVVSGILFGIVLSTSIITFISFVLIPISGAFASYVVGLYKDARNPRFEWNNVTEVVKQGGSVITSMIIVFISCCLGMATTILFGDIFSILIPIIIIVMSYLILLRTTKVTNIFEN